MKKLYLILCVALSCSYCSKKNSTPNDQTEQMDWAIVIHGGAGGFWNGNIDPDQKARYDKSLKEAIGIGSKLLEEGKSSLEAVEATINFLEDDSLFNAGVGAVLTSEGTVELDASIMTGQDLNAGAVAGVSHVRHPISAARLVMTNSPHVLLSGQGADEFAKSQQLELVENNFFITERRLKSYTKRRDEVAQEKMGTVGCVALDKQGNLTAGTSTGGTFYKQWGRIGDSPIIGAGTYADNNTCGVSATGTGEFFIRGTVARDISALMEYKNYSAQQAATEVINQKLASFDSPEAQGGVIVLDRNGQLAYAFNTFGMLYAYLNSNGEEKIGLYK